MNQNVEKIVDKYIKEYEKKQGEYDDFVREGKYVEILEEIIRKGKQIDNDSYAEPNPWTADVEMLFDFIFNSAHEMRKFDTDVFIKYKDKYISFFEIHGQGCYQSISIHNECEGIYINFQDIISYQKTGQMPYKYEALNLIHKAIDALKVAVDGLSNADFDKLRDFVENLIE